MKSPLCLLFSCSWLLIIAKINNLVGAGASSNRRFFSPWLDHSGIPVTVLDLYFWVWRGNGVENETPCPPEPFSQRHLIIEKKKADMYILNFSFQEIGCWSCRNPCFMSLSPLAMCLTVFSLQYWYPYRCMLICLKHWSNRSSVVSCEVCFFGCMVAGLFGTTVTMPAILWKRE